MDSYVWTLPGVATLIGSMIALTSAASLWPKRGNAAARWLIGLCLTSGLWGLLTVPELLATRLELALMWSRLSYLAIATVPPLFVIFVFVYVRDWEPTGRTVGLLFVVPAITIVLALTNSIHHWHTASATLDPKTFLLSYVRGPWYPIYWVYSYVLLGIGFLLLLVSVLRDRDIFMWQRFAITAVCLTPAVINVAYFSVLAINWDMTPIGFGVACFLLMLSLRWQSLFDLVPLLRTHLLDTMSEAVVLIDSRGRIADYNQAMVSIAPQVERAIGLPCQDMLPRQIAMCGALVAGKLANETLELDVGREQRFFEARVRHLALPGGRSRGNLVVLYDITEEHRLAAERDGLLNDLRQAVARAFELAGLIPICANCKRIRDDEGFWHEVEAFLGDHSEAEMAEAICPACQSEMARKLGDASVAGAQQ